MTFFLIFLANAVCIFVLIAVHESGHFLAGWAGGIPLSAMRIRLLTFPQHVSLRDGEEWVTPFNLERYVAIMQRHLGSGARLFLYTAGGMILGTVFTVAAVVLAKETGLSGIAIMIAAQSLGMGLIYIFAMDLPMALRRGYPRGRCFGHVVYRQDSDGGVRGRFIGHRRAPAMVCHRLTKRLKLTGATILDFRASTSL
jgi:hypothetical protein